MTNFDFDSHMTLKSIEHKLNGVECRLVALDNKFDSFEKKMTDVILRCLDKQTTVPYLEEQPTNLVHDVDSKPLNGVESSANTTQEITDNFEMISLLDGTAEDADEVSNCTILDPDSLQKSTKLENHREYGKFNRFLDILSKCLKQNENQRKSFQPYMNHFTSGLIKKLRAADKLFDKMYSSHLMLGNNFDTPIDLKYNEYNLTIILKLPFENENILNVIQSPEKCGYCRLNVTVNANDNLTEEFSTKFVNKDRLLRVNEFYGWLERIISEYFTGNGNKLEIIKKNYESLTFEINRLDKSTTGTSIQIYVPKENIHFSIDIGLGLEFDQNVACCNVKRSQIIGAEKWIATVKQDKNQDGVEWLCTYYTVERRMLQDTNKAVPLIRIFKQFFTSADMPFMMNTYTIENIFLTEIAKQEDARQTEFWTSSLASLFLHMKTVILQCLYNRSIPYFWDQSINLLHDIDLRLMHDILLEQTVKLSEELRNSNTTSDVEPNFKAVFYKKETMDCTKSVIPKESAHNGTSKKPKKELNASQVLQLIGNFIQVTDRRAYIEHYDAVIKFFLNQLKTDDTFKLIFKRQEMAGSYRDGLKISLPNEFDTILQLDFGSNLLVERISGEPAHCSIKIIKFNPKAKPYLQQFIDSDEYLLQDEIMIWLHKLFSRILNPFEGNDKTFQIGEQSYQYRFSINGPAFTFKITVVDTVFKFDMDLVPVIPFDHTQWVATRPYSDTINQISWIAVPKPPKREIRRNRSFICSYTEIEKHILHSTHQTKNIIRIFKKLRDNHPQLKDLKSYYIKTIFLWQFDKTTIGQRKQFWSRSMEVLFENMFKIILKHIESRELNFYWEPSYNMFETIAGTKLKSWEDKLRKIYSHLETIKVNNPKALFDIILTQDEKHLIESKYETSSA